MNDEIVLGFRLASGDFTSELRMPLPRSQADADRAALRWLDFMSTGLRIAAERMDAQWPVSTIDQKGMSDAQ